MEKTACRSHWSSLSVENKSIVKIQTLKMSFLRITLEIDVNVALTFNLTQCQLRDEKHTQ
jgi:hypothetical protein